MGKQAKSTLNYKRTLGEKLMAVKRYLIFFQRPVMIIWLIAYIFLTSMLIAWLVHHRIVFAQRNISYWIRYLDYSLLIFLVTVSVALSEFIEKILRFVEDVRRVATSTEKERLLPLFEEVYQNAKSRLPKINERINVYILDDISVNAFSLGRRTIAVTRGLIAVMDDDEIKGILAHEFGHTAYKDPTIQLLVSVGSSIFLWVLIAVKWGLGVLIQKLTKPDNKATLISSIIAFFKWIFELVIMLITLVATIILMADSRKKEFRADKYAMRLGYGVELTMALYKLYDMQISDKRNVIEKIKASHPRLAYRIEALESM